MSHEFTFVVVVRTKAAREARAACMLMIFSFWRLEVSDEKQIAGPDLRYFKVFNQLD